MDIGGLSGMDYFVCGELFFALANHQIANKAMHITMKLTWEIVKKHTPENSVAAFEEIPKDAR